MLEKEDISNENVYNIKCIIINTKNINSFKLK